MVKSDLIKPLLKVLSCKSEAKNALEIIFSEIKDALKRGDKVVISGFGTFYVRLSAPRRINLPKKKGMILARPKRKVKFLPSKKMLEYVKED